MLNDQQRLGNFGTDAAEYPEPAAECLGCAGAPPELEFTPCRHALFCESCFQKWKQVIDRAVLGCFLNLLFFCRHPLLSTASDGH